VGPAIVKDFISFNWQWLTSLVKELGWGQLTTNMLFVGLPGSVTPCHYDEQSNLFAQVSVWFRWER
jgi:hypoxia-inducible factor 1-alpha inhibitor (HIF hydroxylase)